MNPFQGDRENAKRKINERKTTHASSFVEDQISYNTMTPQPMLDLPRRAGPLQPWGEINSGLRSVYASPQAVWRVYEHTSGLFFSHGSLPLLSKADHLLL